MSIKTNIIYVRHGEVPGNNPDPAIYTYTGCHYDESLTSEGHQQARKCAELIVELQKKGVIGKVAAIYSSHLKRAVETAHPLADKLGLPIEIRKNLREIDWGCADGKLVEQMKKEFGEKEKAVNDQFKNDRRRRWDHLPVFDHAEKFNALLRRNVDELNEIAQKHPDGWVIVFGHGRALRTLIAESLDTEDIKYPSNCSLAHFVQSERLKFAGVISG